MPDDLFIKPGITIPAWELQYTTSTSGGPGGQHANRSQTRITLTWYPEKTSILVGDEVGRAHLIRRLKNRINTNGAIQLSCATSRSQKQNLELAQQRLCDIILHALHLPRPRQKTYPTAASKRRRLKGKRILSEKKRLRQPPSQNLE